ncbi:unnamed protein product [Aphanomyces euteiches]|uniref:F-box domain-containing protein n=1 Tax=Aphanomyces euteiches TaxID=100861 RepID=A0A6G0XIM3_9STRA|nr:hypothetical protein Ae201684_004341 [Aphanomyces euteiches]KAH9093989.1 hypothetical protein Ae201684P_016608 [Aphanomyces euteiches]KAH9136283.1 hypothetical protein AeRB84_018504 [Aphanomyces euteiches]
MSAVAPTNTHGSGCGGGGAAEPPIWDEDLTHLLNSPVHGSLPWGNAPPTRKDIGRLSSFDLAEMNQAAAMTSQDISYERKKSRAKITRVEVNNGFDELLQVLRLPNSRKNSRAKVIQYACERIRALEQENERLKQQVPAMPPPAPGAMVWIPCSLTPTPLLLPPLRVPQKKKPRKNSPTRAASTAKTQMRPSMLHSLVSSCPHLLHFFDASTLTRLMETSTEWKKFFNDAKQAYLWESLILLRWRVSASDLPRLAPSGSMRHKWVHLHRTMLVPRGVYSEDPSSEQGKANSIVAIGRARGIDVWGVLARRSNSRTTRSVWRDGSVTVMQVVELRLIVQNMSGLPVSVALPSIAVWPFQVLDASYGTLFEPRWIAWNGAKCSQGNASSTLRQMDFGVVSIYVSCPQVEFEQEFLARARSIQIACTRADESQVIMVEAPFMPPTSSSSSSLPRPILHLTKERLLL